MARPRSEEKQRAILTATMELVAEQGFQAATAEIAKRAGVPHGTVFTYFDTKVDLLNALYLDLKIELANTILNGMPGEENPRAQLRHLWMAWTGWGVSNPLKRRALAQLSVSDQITESIRKAAGEAAAPAVNVIQRLSSKGALSVAPIAYVGALVETIVVTTIDFMIRDSKDAEVACESGFEALWQALR